MVLFIRTFLPKYRHKDFYKACIFTMILCYSFFTGVFGEQFDKIWEGRDPFDDIYQKFMAVNDENCAIKHTAELKMDVDTVSHKPDIKEININPVFPNRTALLHLHNMALNRAFFFSYILQSRYFHFAFTWDMPKMNYIQIVFVFLSELKIESAHDFCILEKGSVSLTFRFLQSESYHSTM